MALGTQGQYRGRYAPVSPPRRVRFPDWLGGAPVPLPYRAQPGSATPSVFADLGRWWRGVLTPPTPATPRKRPLPESLDTFVVVVLTPADPNPSSSPAHASPSE
jgi:hypothetical protein